MRKNFFSYILILVLSVSYLTEAQNLKSENSFSENVQVERKLQVMKSCYEVVVKKPAEDSQTYDKPLNWDLLNYRDREDDYYSLGTAFAISEKELVTAAHVLCLDDNSKVYQKRFIREKYWEGNKLVEKVYEVDQVTSFNDHKDYVVFTVKDKEFGDWLKIEKEFEFNTKIFAAGNAYGEGIVVREGLLLDMIPEDENGEWNYLKSSIATNPGSSGGPLLNSNFEVIGIVIARKDDFSYSLPLAELEFNKGIMHKKMIFAFFTFSERLISTFDNKFKLPENYQSFMKKINKDYSEFYTENMEKLFKENASDMFPSGSASLKALHNSRSSKHLQIFLKDNDSKSWFSTQLEYENTDIGKNGNIYWSEIYKGAGIWFVEIKKPEDISLGQLYASPKTQMDLILKGINMTRKITDSDPGSRILSYGPPRSSASHTDLYGRFWTINSWLIEYIDEVVITFSTPTPDGIALIYMSKKSKDIDYGIYDMKKMTDFINISYVAELSDWKEFLHQKDYLFEPISAIELSYKSNEVISLKTNTFSVDIDSSFFNIQQNNQLKLYFDIYPFKQNPVWGVRKFVLDDGFDGNNYVLFYRWIKPVDDLPSDFHDDWNKKILNQEHPYNGSVYSDEDRTCIGSVHPEFSKKDFSNNENSIAYTIFISNEGLVSDQKMKDSMKLFGTKLIFY